jgi:hypothetical protein
MSVTGGGPARVLGHGGRAWSKVSTISSCASVRSCAGPARHARRLYKLHPIYNHIARLTVDIVDVVVLVLRPNWCLLPVLVLGLCDTLLDAVLDNLREICGSDEGERGMMMSVIAGRLDERAGRAVAFGRSRGTHGRCCRATRPSPCRAACTPQRRAAWSPLLLRRQQRAKVLFSALRPVGPGWRCAECAAAQDAVTRGPHGPHLPPTRKSLRPAGKRKGTT